MIVPRPLRAARKKPKVDYSPPKWTCVGAALGGAVRIRGTVSPSGQLTKVSGVTMFGADAEPFVMECDLLPPP